MSYPVRSQSKLQNAKVIQSEECVSKHKLVEKWICG